MDVIHHPGQTTSEVEDWYDEFFGPHSRPGDWIWSRTDGHRTMLIIFPLIGMAPALHNQLEQNGGELIHIHVNHQPNPRGWADHGPINGWDGDEDSPTLHPSIFVRGLESSPGWHGFLQAGQLVNLDGSIVGLPKSP